MRWADVKENKKDKIDRNISKLAEKLKRGNKPAVGFKTKFMFNVNGKTSKFIAKNMVSVTPED